MYKCTFTYVYAYSISIYFTIFSEIAGTLQAFWKEIVEEREKEKVFKRIFSHKEFMILLEKSFLTHRLKDTENSICVRLKPNSGISFEFFSSFDQKIPKGIVHFSIKLFEDNMSIGTFKIECQRQVFNALCQTVKEEQAKRRKLAREQKALKVQALNK